MGILWFILGIIYACGAMITYNKFTDSTKFEKCWFAVLWPCIAPLYGIYKLQNICRK